MGIEVKPYTTLALASDENYEVLVKSSINGSIEVDVDGTIVKTVSFSSGVSIVQIGTPNDFIITSDSGKEIKLHIKDSGGNEIMLLTLPVYFIDGTNGSVEVYDKNTNEQLVCDFALTYIDKDKAYIRQYRGLSFSIPKQSNNLPYTSMFLEVISGKEDGRKYYYATRVDKLSLGTINKIYIVPQKYYDVVLEVEMDTTRLPTYFDWIADSVGWISQVLGHITVATVLSNYYYPTIRAILNDLGIHVPVMKIEYIGNNVYKIMFRVDAVDKLVIVAVIVALILSGIIAFTIRDIYIQKIQADVVVETNKTIRQTNEIRLKMIEACKELSTSTDEYIACIKDVDKFMQNATTHDLQLLYKLLDKYNSTKSDLDKLKDIVIVGGAVAGGIIILKYLLSTR